MSYLLHFRKWVGVLCLAVLSQTMVLAQSGYTPEAGEYSIAGALAGDQIFPELALGSTGGLLVWQDNITDGSGWGVSARKLNSSFSGSLSSFRVNQQGADDQENARVSLLKTGGAVFVWQGGKRSFQHVYARFLAADGTWGTGDLPLNSFTNGYQISPAVATLTNGDVVAVWGSINQESANSMQGVYGQRLTPTGQKVGGEFAVNLTTAYNQRTPVITSLKNGGFVVVWVSEQQRFDNSVDLFARIYDAAGAPVSGEVLVSAGTNVCANPSITALGDGFAVAWGEQDIAVRTNGWDIVARTFSATGFGGTARRLNATTYGDQYAPKISAAGSDLLVTWISMGQDGSREGIYARNLHADGSLVGDEFRVNTSTVSQQLYPAVASDGAARFLVAWTSFGGGVNSFDLLAQRYASISQPLLAPSAPAAAALDSSKLQVAWAGMDGYSVANYEVYADSAASATAVVTSNMWRMTGLAPSSTHTFRLAYVLTDGRRSPLSAVGSGTTWGTDDNLDGLPDDWEALYFGNNSTNWPVVTVDSDGDGVNNRDEFLAGTNPTDAASVLRMQLADSAQGLFLSWNTKPGQIYQVQTALTIGAWTNLGLPRFANGAADSMYVGGSPSAYYRVLRVR